MNIYFLRLIDDSRTDFLLLVDGWSRRKEVVEKRQSEESPIFVVNPDGGFYVEIGPDYTERKIGHKIYTIHSDRNSFSFQPNLKCEMSIGINSLCIRYDEGSMDTIYVSKLENMERLIHPSVKFKFSLIKRYFVILSSQGIKQDGEWWLVDRY
jgi:hypothetical protein